MEIYSNSTLVIGWVLIFQTLACTLEVRKFCHCVQQMTKYRPSIVLLLYWSVQAMRIFFILIVMWGIKYSPLNSNRRSPSYPMWADYFGFTLSILSMICIPGYWVYYALLGPKKDFIKNIQNGIRSNINFSTIEENETCSDQQQKSREEYELQ